MNNFAKHDSALTWHFQNIILFDNAIILFDKQYDMIFDYVMVLQ